MRVDEVFVHVACTSEASLTAVAAHGRLDSLLHCFQVDDVLLQLNIMELIAMVCVCVCACVSVCDTLKHLFHTHTHTHTHTHV